MAKGQSDKKIMLPGMGMGMPDETPVLRLEGEHAKRLMGMGGVGDPVQMHLHGTITHQKSLPGKHPMGGPQHVMEIHVHKMSPAKAKAKQASDQDEDDMPAPAAKGKKASPKGGLLGNY